MSSVLTVFVWRGLLTVSGDFQRYDYSSALIGLLEPGYDHPASADGIDTFYFGGGYDKDQDWCEYMCAQVRTPPPPSSSDVM